MRSISVFFYAIILSIFLFHMPEYKNTVSANIPFNPYVTQ